MGTVGYWWSQRISSRRGPTLLIGSGLLLMATFLVLGGQTASAAASCAFNGQGGIATGVTPGGTIAVVCTGLPSKQSVVLVETSALAAFVANADQEDEADVGALQLGNASTGGALAVTFNVPNPYTDSDSNGVCPPTQAQVDAGAVACRLTVATLSGLTYGTATLQYAGQPTPQSPTLGLSPGSACVGQQVTISDGSGSGDWWGNAGAETSLSSADISVGGVAALDPSASISAATYSYNPPSPLASPVLSGSFAVPPGVDVGVQDVTVTEPNTTGLPGTVSASMPLTIVATGCPPSQTTRFLSAAPTDAVFGGPTYTPSASATSGLPVTLTIDPSAAPVCSMSAGTVSYSGAGTCTIDANQAGSDAFLAAPQVQQSFLVDKATPSAPTITNIPGSGAAEVEGDFNPVVETTGDGVTSVTSSTSSVCPVGPTGTVVFLNAGLCTLTAHVAPGADYLPADGAPQSFTVGPDIQAITSSNQASATSRSPFSFTVTTIGATTPVISEKGALPQHLRFVDDGNGTATIAGTPVVKKAKVYHLTITAVFGSGASKYVAVQTFTLTVSPA